VTVTLMKFKVEKLKVKVLLKMFLCIVLFSFCIVMFKNVSYISFCFSVLLEFYAELFIVMVKELCLVLSVGDGKFKILLHRVRLRLSKCRRDVITTVYHQVGKRRSLPARCKRLREAASVFF